MTRFSNSIKRIMLFKIMDNCVTIMVYRRLRLSITIISNPIVLNDIMSLLLSDEFGFKFFRIASLI